MSPRQIWQIVSDRADSYFDPEAWGINAERFRLSAEVVKAADRKRRLNAIKALYEFVKPDLLAEPAHRWAHGPYLVDWVSIFTPIEAALWNDIRCVGAVLYPQYPVGRFYVDFGNPVAKVAIECDGIAYHLDKVADAARQREIEAAGWTVYRITGRDCFTDGRLVYDDDGCESYEEGAALKFITDISRAHRLSPRFIRTEDDDE
jgi:hypothetical protein